MSRRWVNFSLPETEREEMNYWHGKEKSPAASGLFWSTFWQPCRFLRCETAIQPPADNTEPRQNSLFGFGLWAVGMIARVCVCKLHDELAQQNGAKKIGRRGSFGDRGYILSCPAAAAFVRWVWLGLLENIRLCDFFGACQTKRKASGDAQMAEGKCSLGRGKAGQRRGAWAGGI